jgi:signal transduction histidine kinase
MIDINRTKLNIDEFLKNTADNLKILGAEKNINLFVDSNTNSFVEIDKELMMQAISNLIDNAIKYGDENNTVTIKGENLEADKIKISIINYGEGIPEEALFKIFDRFYRVESSRNRNTGGVGLGLSVVKAIVTWHNADIYAGSKPNGVTEFSIIMQKVT